jgi:hypothetical protein
MNPQTAPAPANRTCQPLPFLATFDDAEALACKENDTFYLAAFLIQLWLSDLVLRNAAEYAEKKNPRDRSLQSGESFRALQEYFKLETPRAHTFLLANLHRFCVADPSPANALRRALIPLMAEHRHPQPSSPSTSAPPEAAARATLIRWCDWLDAALHLRTHRHYHLAPGCFHPDPAVRELALLADAERHLADLPDRARQAWFADLTAASHRHHHSPLWPQIGKALSAEARSWAYPELDTLIIALWPLVKKYRWTYRNLMDLLAPFHAAQKHGQKLCREESPSPQAAHNPAARRKPHSALRTPNSTLSRAVHDAPYPCDREQNFGTYCTHVLSLFKQSRGRTNPKAPLPGLALALEICPILINDSIS